MVPTTLAFIAAYNSPQALVALSYEAFTTFAQQQGYWNQQGLLACYARLQHTLFAQHPDQAIFTSLPGVGAFLAPALLAKLGDDRERFHSAASLQALAGTCPVTMASGKRKRVAYWQQIRPRCASEHDAYRRLANRWLAVLWKLWQSRELNDEAYHLQQRRYRSRPLA